MLAGIARAGSTDGLARPQRGPSDIVDKVPNSN
jgi:hypothetical protein